MGGVREADLVTACYRISEKCKRTSLTDLNNYITVNQLNIFQKNVLNTHNTKKNYENGPNPPAIEINYRTFIDCSGSEVWIPKQPKSLNPIFRSDLGAYNAVGCRL